MPDFLLELLSEEIPARMQKKAAAELSTRFEALLTEAGLSASGIESFVTPRRLGLIARDIPAASADQDEERRGPRSDAPEAAVAGFLKSAGLKRKNLEERADAKGTFLYARIARPGRPAEALLAERLPALLEDFPWPKSMRWGAASAAAEAPRWVRPLHGILALLGDRIVAFEFAGVKSGASTLGHRFHHPGAITVGGAADYREKLLACHVVTDPTERRARIEKGAKAAARRARLVLVDDPALVEENAGLTEWPVPLAGKFDPAYLELPREVIQLTMRANQKYFACTKKDGTLAPAFVCIANIEAEDPAMIVAGNQRVLAARLADAKFFWEQDLKIPLAELAGQLDQIIFHEKLGTLAERVARIGKLVRWMAEEKILHGITPAEGEQAARLAKADLVSQMVGEFPELQGVVGGYLARAQGIEGRVADAIGDHYRPAGPSEAVPATPLGTAIGLADKIDTLVAFFSIGEKPTGSRDPFGLRRAALGVIRTIVEADLRLPLRDVLIQASVLLTLSRLGAIGSVTFPHLLGEDEGDHEISASVGSFTWRFGRLVVARWDAANTPNIERGRLIEQVSDLSEEVFAFLSERLKVQQREAGLRHDLIDAAFAAEDENDLVRLLARGAALQSLLAGKAGADLLAGYKRAANILRKEGKAGGSRQTSFAYAPLPAESALDVALDAAEPKARAAILAEDWKAAMTVLAGLRGPIDAFFDTVKVNDEDEVKRETRLALLARVTFAIDMVADFSKIEG